MNRSEIPSICPICGSQASERIVDSIDVGVGTGIPCEIEVTCSSKECDHYIGYWTTGHFEPGEGIKTKDLHHLFGAEPPAPQPEQWGSW